MTPRIRPISSDVPRFVAVFLLFASALAAQPTAITVPNLSPRASVSQTVGLTDMTITYCRPGVKGRKIWGELVPYDDVARDAKGSHRCEL